jgi:hypothetical protein
MWRRFLSTVVAALCLQAAPRLLAQGDTFAVMLPPVGPLDGILASLNDSRLLSAADARSPGSTGPGSADTAQPAAASAAELQPAGRGGRLVYFRVAELQPADDTALAVDPTSTVINIHVSVLTRTCATIRRSSGLAPALL